MVKDVQKSDMKVSQNSRILENPEILGIGERVRIPEIFGILDYYRIG